MITRRTFFKSITALFASVTIAPSVLAETPTKKPAQTNITKLVKSIDVVDTSKKQFDISRYQTNDDFGFWIDNSYFKASYIRFIIKSNPVDVTDLYYDKWHIRKPGPIASTLIVQIISHDVIWQLEKLSRLLYCGSFEKVVFRMGKRLLSFTDCILSEVEQRANIGSRYFDEYTLTFHGGSPENI